MITCGATICAPLKSLKFLKEEVAWLDESWRNQVSIPITQTSKTIARYTASNAAGCCAGWRRQIGRKVQQPPRPDSQPHKVFGLP